jgi:hypothetical protein
VGQSEAIYIGGLKVRRPKELGQLTGMEIPKTGRTKPALRSVNGQLCKFRPTQRGNRHFLFRLQRPFEAYCEILKHLFLVLFSHTQGQSLNIFECSQSKSECPICWASAMAMESALNFETSFSLREREVAFEV